MKQQFAFRRLLEIPKGHSAWMKITLPGLSASYIFPIPRKGARKNVLNPDLAAALDLQKYGTEWLPYCWLQLPQLPLRSAMVLFIITRSSIKRQRTTLRV